VVPCLRVIILPAFDFPILDPMLILDLVHANNGFIVRGG
jgi:hypothetical protein